jgi:mono/diheme cytochrome c family protein
MLRICFGAIIIGSVLALTLAGVRGQKSQLTHIEWFNDMAHQPKFQPQHRSEFYTDGRAARQPVAGTVPIGFTLEHRYDQTGGSNLAGTFTSLPEYAQTGRMGDVYGDGIPEPLAAEGTELIKRGQERFNINCAVCHGRAGAGDGVAKSFGLATVASLLTQPVMEQPDGKIYNTITHGRGTMGAYGPVITVEDRWAIVSYVRALQKIGTGKLAAPAPAPAPAAPAVAGAPAAPKPEEKK